jgi:hypothetical protein
MERAQNNLISQEEEEDLDKLLITCFNKKVNYNGLNKLNKIVADIEEVKAISKK